MLRFLFPDRFILLLMAVIAAASLFPAEGQMLATVGLVSNVAIFSLFFFHGMRLPHQAVIDGAKHWRLQLAVLAISFAALPLFGVLLASLAPGMLTQDLWLGVLFLCVLPSTVQAAIASASMAGGNVAVSVIAAAVSNLAGVVMTPLIFTLIAKAGGMETDLSAIGRIATLLLLPFALGQLARRWGADWVERRRAFIGRLDRLTILLAVFTAFSAATAEGVWSRIDLNEIARLTLVVLVLMFLGFGSAWFAGRAMGLSRADRITLFFSGAHKSLATGAPMARILFPAGMAGMMIIPLMLYHQLQLMFSAWIAARWAQER